MSFTPASFTALLAGLHLMQSNNNTMSTATPPEWESVLQGQGSSCQVNFTSSTPPPTPSFEAFDLDKANLFRYRQQQSVNLGSWLVHEAWMTPSLFKCAGGKKASEIDIASGWGSHSSAQALLENHWDTWITAQDFEWLASIGINTVRLPIGYWNLGPKYCEGTPFEPVASVYQNSWTRVLNAVQNAANAGIGVLVDLHGAPGSQNGQQHSGISDGKTGLFGNNTYESKTMDVLQFLTQQFAAVNNVVGIQMLNEPKNVPELADFYSRAIDQMRSVSTQAAELPLYLHDGFDLNRFSSFVSNRTDFVVQDHHSYFVFTPNDESEPAHSHTSDVDGNIAQSLISASRKQDRRLIIGEWSCALTDQSLSGESDKAGAQRAFCEAQKEVYANGTAGWTFWALKTEDCDNNIGWCFKNAVGNALPKIFFSFNSTRVTNSSAYPTIVFDRITPPAANDILSGIQNGDGNYTVEVAQADLRRRHPRDWTMYSRRSQAPMKLPSTGELTQLPADQRAIVKGYSDGYLAAKWFAQQSFSKLGFTGPYIQHSLSRLDAGVIDAAQNGTYAEWFMAGLSDGEEDIQCLLDGK